MIEMRILVVPMQEKQRGLLRGTASQMWEEVLQFRWNKALVGINTGTWSPWQDVPIVAGDFEQSSGDGEHG